MLLEPWRMGWQEDRVSMLLCLQPPPLVDKSHGDGCYCPHDLFDPFFNEKKSNIKTLLPLLQDYKNPSNLIGTTWSWIGPGGHSQQRGRRCPCRHCALVPTLLWDACLPSIVSLNIPRWISRRYRRVLEIQSETHDHLWSFYQFLVWKCLAVGCHKNHQTMTENMEREIVTAVAVTHITGCVPRKLEIPVAFPKRSYMKWFHWSQWNAPPSNKYSDSFPTCCR